MNVTDILRRGLIVSCQALEGEPLHSPFIMSKMALAAMQGGAIGIRANSYDDIVKIKEEVNLPIIGIIKKHFDDSPIYITPTLKEVEEIYNAGARIVAIDATLRPRPNGQSLEDFVSLIRLKFPDLFIMADIATLDEAKNAEMLGFDLIASTLSGYTEETEEKVLPNLDLISELVKHISVPIIAEGGYHTPEQFKKALEIGAYSVVVGTAITRPREITKRFVDTIKLA